MCTAVTYKTKNFYFGRTLDLDYSYKEEVVIMPRNYRFGAYAIIGMAFVPDNFPLYYDAVNEKGLCMAGLKFVGNAYYNKAQKGKNNIAQYEFIPYILGRCVSVKEALAEIRSINLTDTPYNDKLPLAELHWLVADRERAVTVEFVKEGLKIYQNPVGVLTNNPPFDMQLFNLGNFMGLSSEQPKNTFSKKLTLKSYSRGMGALGLPGDYSSQSRFVRAAFAKFNSVSDDGEEESVNQFFHILGTVALPRGICKVGSGCQITVYSSCINADSGVYYYTSYENHRITAVDMHAHNLSGKSLFRYPVARREDMLFLKPHK